MRRLLLVTILAAGCSVLAGAQDPLESHLQSVDWVRYQDEAVRLMQEYLRIDTSNPPGHELKAAQFFQRLFHTAGIPHGVFEYAPLRANVYAVLKGAGGRRPLVLLNHLDVVRAEPTNWRVPPFSGEILEGAIYGRGALDMKDEGLLQAMVMLVAARERLPLERDLIFLGTADEEVDGTGSAWLLQNHPELLGDAEYLLTEGGTNLVYPDLGTVYGICVAEKAPYWLRLTARGPGGHGSVPLADSAPNRLVKALHRILNWQPPIRLLPQVERYFHDIAPLEREPRASQFRNIRRALQDHTFARSLADESEFGYMLRTTASLTVLKGSEQTNVIPQVASCELDVRLLPDEDPQTFLEQLRSVVADPHVQVEPIGRFRPPNSSPADTMLYHLIEQIIRKHNPGALVVPTLNSGYTESQMYRPLGITCYGFTPIEITPELEATQHAVNERVPVEQIKRGLRILYEVVARAANQ